MRKVEWHEGFSLGRPNLDEAHRRLIGLVNGLVEAEPAGDRDAVREGARLLAAALQEHWEEEGRLFGLKSPSEERGGAGESQANILSVISAALAQGRLPEGGAEFLRAWLLHHLICGHPAGGSPRHLDDKARGGFLHDLMRRLDVLPLRWRILLLAALPLAGVLLVGGYEITDRARTAAEMKELQGITVLSTKVGDLVHHLQRERGLTAIRLSGSKGDEARELDSQRADTDAHLAAVADGARALAIDGAVLAARQLEASLGQVRRQIDLGQTTMPAIIGLYGAFIAELLDGVYRLVYREHSSDLQTDAASYLDLMHTKETAGIERAAAAGSLASGRLSAADHARLHALVVRQQVLEEHFLSTATPDAAAAYLRAKESEAAKRVEAFRRIILDGERPGAPPISAEDWYDAATARIDQLKLVEDDIARRIIARAAALSAEAYEEALWILGAIGLMVSGIVGATVLLAYSVVPPLTALHRAMQGLAGGDRAVQIPATGLRDEIGAMARTLDRFREGLVIRDLLAAEARLETSRHLSSVADNLPGFIFQHRQGAGGEPILTYVSERVRDYVGEGPERLIGAPADRLLACAQPAERAEMDRLARESAQSGRAYQIDLPVAAPDETTRWLRVLAAPRRGVDGLLVWDGVALDVTHLKEVERQRNSAAQRLHQLYKLQALTQLAGGMSHEINNMLQPILGLTELAIKDLPPGSRPREFMENVLKAAAQARDLVRKVSGFSRTASPKCEPVVVSGAVERTLAILRGVLPKNVTVETDLATGDAAILANEAELQQVLTNLCMNAVHAMELQGGRLTIATALVGRSAEAHPWLRLRVSDTGQGIDPMMLERIFEPFFTTKSVGKGTGMGLALVHSIVTGLGGHIEVDSAPGKGATFDLFFPLHQPPTGRASDDRQPERAD